MKTNFIYQGNCIDILKKEIKKEGIDLVFADPPYNLSGKAMKWKGNQTGGDWYMIDEKWDKMDDESYFKFTYDWINNCKSVLKNNGSIYISSTFHNLGEIIYVLKKLNFKINNIIVWNKINAMPNMTKRVFTHSCEYVVWAVKDKGWTFNYEDLKKINPEKKIDGSTKQMRDVWKLPLVQGKERLKNGNRASHPAQKPEEMLKRIIIASSNKGEIVLDPFLGSGTTAYIAKIFGRKYIGIELEKKYIKDAEKRLNKKDLFL